MVVASKFFWALGYNQVEMFISTFDPQKVVIEPGATKKRPSGARTPFTQDDLNAVLEGVARNKDGTYRVAAGRLLPGKVIGSFRYSGTRPDDPNDIVPHEHRRDLRALRVFGAWTNLTDLKAGNTLDTLMTENGRGIVKHILQDVGSTFGMVNREHEWDIGWEHFYEGDATMRRLVSFGFALSPWQTVPYIEHPAIQPRGHIDPQLHLARAAEVGAGVPQPGLRDREVAGNDPGPRDHAGKAPLHCQAERHLAHVLGQRRDTIGRVYLTAVNPISSPRLDPGGSLTFENPAVAGGFAKEPTAYRAVWSRFDNATGNTSPIGETRSTSTTVAGPRDLPSAPDSFLEVDLSAESAQFPSWQQPVRTFFRRTSAGWKLVGLERLPETLDGPAAASSKNPKPK